MVVAGHASEQGALAIQVAKKTTMDPNIPTFWCRLRAIPPLNLLTVYAATALQTPPRAPPPVSSFFSRCTMS